MAVISLLKSFSFSASLSVTTRNEASWDLAKIFLNGTSSYCQSHEEFCCRHTRRKEIWWGCQQEKGLRLLGTSQVFTTVFFVFLLFFSKVLFRYYSCSVGDTEKIPGYVCVAAINWKRMLSSCRFLLVYLAYAPLLKKSV